MYVVRNNLLLFFHHGLRAKHLYSLEYPPKGLSKRMLPTPQGGQHPLRSRKFDRIALWFYQIFYTDKYITFS